VSILEVKIDFSPLLCGVRLFERVNLIFLFGEVVLMFWGDFWVEALVVFGTIFVKSLLG